MSQIHIHKFNDTYAKVICDDSSVEMDLHDHFAFHVPGYQFMPKYKAGIWDGKIKLYNTMNHNLYVGLLPRLAKFCKSENHELVGFKDVFSYHPMRKEESDAYVYGLGITSDGKKVIPYASQLEAIHHCLQYPRTLLLSPTGSGKSLILYALIRRYMEESKRILLLVPTVQLVEQMYSDFADYSSEVDWNVEDHAHRIYSGKEKDTNKQLTISTWQSLYKFPKKWFSRYDVGILDEAHHGQGDSISSIFQKMTDCPVKIGTTGTIHDIKCHKLVLEGVFGPIYQAAKTHELIDKNVLSNIKINVLELQHTKDARKMVGNSAWDYHKEMDFLCQHPKRNKFICDLTNSINGNILVLYQYIEKHGHLLREELKKSDKQVYYIDGQTPVEMREHIRKTAEKTNDLVLLCSYGTTSTGWNVKNIHNIIFASPYKSQIKVLQSIGRGLRKHGDKTALKLYDIADNMCNGNRKNYTYQHMLNRMEIYVREKFPYKVHRVTL